MTQQHDSAVFTQSLQGRTVLVFGAGAPLEDWNNGKAAAVTYARAGAQVVCVYKDLAAAKRSADHILGEGGEALALEADVCNTETVEKTVALALEHFGKSTSCITTWELHPLVPIRYRRRSIPKDHGY